MIPALPDVAASLPGPGWLVAHRAAAAARIDGAPLPTTDEEVWRYSRVGELDLTRFTPVTAAPPAGADLPGGVDALLGRFPAAERAGLVVLHDGTVARVELEAALVDRGVEVVALAGTDHGDVLGSVMGEHTDAFAQLNDALCLDPVLIRVPRGVVVDRPIVVLDWVGTDGAAAFPRLVVLAEDDSEVSVLHWQAGDDVEAFIAPVVELGAGRAARLRYLDVQDRGPRVWQITSQVSRADADASVTAHQIALGGEYARTRADCRLVGRGGSGNLAAAYFGEGDQMLDFRTFQDHIAPDTTSNLLFKGALSGTSRSVYTGLIRVEKEARGTNAFQTNRNLKLSDGAWAESVPNLEIENNDVRCSHASTVGPIDEDQRFYLESRGVPTPLAERLIVAGFFAEVLDQLAVPLAAPLVRAEIDRRLDLAGVAEGSA